ASRCEILFERLGITCKLGTKLIDLTAQIARLLIFDARLLLTFTKRFTSCFEKRCCCTRTLVDRTKRRCRAALLRSLIGLRFFGRSRALCHLHELTKLRCFLLLGSSFTERA